MVERFDVAIKYPCGRDPYAVMVSDPDGSYVMAAHYDAARAALSDRNRRLTAVVEEIASRQTLSGHDGDLDWLIDDARAALTSGGWG